MTKGCSSPVVKSIGGKTYVASGRIDKWNTSISVYPDKELPLVVAKSSLVTLHESRRLVIYFKEGASPWETYDGRSINKEIYSEDG
jgi:hypothetical protein